MRQTVRQVFMESSASNGRASDKIFKVKGLALFTGLVLLSSRLIPRFDSIIFSTSLFKGGVSFSTSHHHAYTWIITWTCLAFRSVVMTDSRQMYVKSTESTFLISTHKVSSHKLGSDIVGILTQICTIFFKLSKRSVRPNFTQKRGACGAVFTVEPAREPRASSLERACSSLERARSSIQLRDVDDDRSYSCTPISPSRADDACEDKFF